MSPDSSICHFGIAIIALAVEACLALTKDRAEGDTLSREVTADAASGAESRA